jgi:hypothetical protein
MVEIIQALECIGCGKLEGPRPCIGICQDRIVDLVYAQDYKDAVAQIELAQGQSKAFARLAKQLAWTTAHGGEWERSYRTLQEQARRILGAGHGPLSPTNTGKGTQEGSQGEGIAAPENGGSSPA